LPLLLGWFWWPSPMHMMTMFPPENLKQNSKNNEYYAKHFFWYYSMCRTESFPILMTPATTLF
jgi:hypothetical protein